MLTALRHAFRQLRQQPLFAALAVGTLGIGIGAAATCFAAVNALLFRPLPVATESERVVRLTQEHHLAPATAGSRLKISRDLSPADAARLLDGTPALDGIWLSSDLTVIVAGERAPLRYLGTHISPNAFALMGVPPQLGRNFTAADGAPGAEPVALLSDAAWRQRFQGRKEAVGSRLAINGVPTTIVGVMPAGWRYPEASDVWLPLPTLEVLAASPDAAMKEYGADGLLATGATLEQLRHQLSQIAPTPLADTEYVVVASEFVARSWRDTTDRSALYFTVLLFGAALAVFLIACANVANLQLARGSVRAPEIAVRVALGANRRQIFRQLLIENLALGLAGAAAGAVVTLWGVDFVVASMTIEQPFWLDFSPDWRVLLFTAGCGIFGALLFGLLPAWRDSQPDILAGIKESSRTGLDHGPYGLRLRNAIVVGEIALALVLLVGAGLMTRSFQKLRAIDPGYEATDVMTFRVGFPLDYGADENAIRDYFRRLSASLQNQPDIVSAAAVTQLPGNSTMLGSSTLLADDGNAPPEQRFEHTGLRGVTPHYFDTLFIPRLAGRDFEAADANRAPVAVVDLAFVTAAGLTPETILGRKVRTSMFKGEAEDPVATIIGVVHNVRHHLEKPFDQPTIYYSVDQYPQNFMSVVLRTTVPPAQLAITLERSVLAVEPGLPIYAVLTLEQVVLRSIWTQQFFSRLFLCAGVIALLLACVGIYAVMTFAVTARRHEIGLRMALGASAGDVVRDVVRRGGRLVVFGLGTGLIAAVLLANLLTGVLHGVSPHDPPTFLAVPVLLATVALLACYLSSWRATRIPPMIAIRGD